MLKKYLAISILIRFYNKIFTVKLQSEFPLSIPLKTMNIFRYVVGQAIDFGSILDEWFLRTRQYVNIYFGGDIQNVRNTSFWDCMSKIQYLSDLLKDEEQGFTIDNFRGVIDEQGIVQAIAVIQDVEFTMKV